MKKILAIALAVVMVLGLATSALAVSWTAPAASSSASPFAIEVVKLGVNADVTGSKYYTVLTDAAAYDFSTIYFAIKLTVPSYANANAYYGNSGFLSGSKVKVTVNYTNVSGKSSETYYVQLTDASQTLWYNGKGFDASWTASANNNCGCGNSHILSAVASGNKEVSIKACVGASGKLSDIKIDGCYSVAAKTFYGVVPCVNCSPVNLNGFLFSGDCAAYNVFFSTNAAGKVTGAYVVDKSSSAKTNYIGAALNFDKELYGWAPSDTVSDCATGSCGIVSFTKVQLPQGAEINATNWSIWNNTFNYSGKSATEMAALFTTWADMASNTDVVPADFSQVYYKDSNKAFQKVTSWNDIKGDIELVSGSVNFYSDEAGTVKAITLAGTGAAGDFFSGDKITSGAALTETVKTYGGQQVSKVWKTYTMGYQYTGTYVQYLKTKYYAKAAEDSYLYKQTSATTVNCDTNEAAYLNALNHLYALLGFTYADVAAGNVYMTEDILLANFGFSTSVCDTKTWGAYTASITVANVAEVPATGSVTYVGFAMIVLAIAAAVVTKKVRA